MSSPFFISLLLVLALAFPLLGAVVLRLLGLQLSPQQRGVIGALVMVLPIASVVILSRTNVPNLRIAGVTVLLTDPTLPPLPAEVLDAITPEPDEPLDDVPTVAPTFAPENTPTVASTQVPEQAPTIQPTAQPTEAPTVTPTNVPTATREPPTATSVPPSATPPPLAATPAPAPAARRIYVVQPGDTLRGIAQQFNVSVAALLRTNNLTPAQADSLRPGQELVIP